MRKVMRLLRIVALCVALAGCATVGTPVVMDKSTLALLKGSWAGKFERRGLDGTVWFQTPVTLEVSGDSQLKGKFSMAGLGQNWETEVSIKGGKGLLGFDFGMREFTLSRKPDGIFRLETSYPSEWEGWPRLNSVVLEKR